MADKDQIAFELYKLEYEKGAERYESIYQSTWTNFSYLTAVTAGILAFGGDAFSPNVTIMLSTLPLLFWYVAVFEPANKYGDQVIDRLEELETILSVKYENELSVTTSPPVELATGLRHFTRFNSRRTAGQRGRTSRWPRVRYLIEGAAVLMFALVLLLLFGVFNLSKPSDSTTLKVDQNQKTLDVKFSNLGAEELEKLSQGNAQIKQDMEQLKRSLEAISNDLKTLKAAQ